MHNKNILIFSLVFLLILFINLTGCFLFPPSNLAEWTVMVYLDADNDLETFGIKDINEMEIVGSSSQVNILVQIDRIPYNVLNSLYIGYLDDFSNSNWTTTRRYYITQDIDPIMINSPLLADLGELNMGDPQTLIDFTSWAITNYPARKYLLVLWNHGGGFRSFSFNTKDISWDYSNGLDKITMPELADALSVISSQAGGKLDILGMDACLMAMTEVAYQIKDFAEIMVASQENTPADGWPYDTILAELIANPSMSKEELAIQIVDKYVLSYPFNNVTCSATDLNKMDTLAQQLSNLAQAVMSDYSTSKNKYIQSGEDSQYFKDPDFVDLYDLCQQLFLNSNSGSVKNLATSIQQTLNYSRIKSLNNGGVLVDSKGLSIYFPWYLSYSSYYDLTNFARDTFWDEMLLHLGL
ncbi:MAG: hypothetical protein Kow00103_14480 [Candidatus Caldatribacteriota bacterium]